MGTINLTDLITMIKNESDKKEELNKEELNNQPVPYDTSDEIPELPEMLQGFNNEFREEDREYLLVQSFFELAVELYYNLTDSEDNRDIALVLLLKARDAAMCTFILQNLNYELEN